MTDKLLVKDFGIKLEIGEERERLEMYIDMEDILVAVFSENILIA